MKEEIINFLKKVKKYNLSEDFFASNSFDWINKIDLEELKELNNLEEKEFTNKLLMYIFGNYPISKEEIEEYLFKLKLNKNPNLDIIIKVVNNYKKDLNNYCMNMNNNANKRVTLIDFLNIFANTDIKKADYAYKSLSYINFQKIDNLYNILKTITTCKSEECSYYIYKELKQKQFYTIDQVLYYFPKFKDDKALTKFYDYYSMYSSEFNYYSQFESKEEVDNMFYLASIQKDSDLYKYDFLKRFVVVDYNNIYHITSETLKCDDKNKIDLLKNAYDFNFENIDCLKLMDTIYSIDNKELIEIMSRYPYSMFYAIMDKIDPIYYFESVSKFNDEEAIEKINNMVKNKKASFYYGKKLGKQLVKIAKKVNDNN